MSLPDERGKLAGKVAAVIGGAAGIGEAVSLSLAAAGVNLAICDWDSTSLAATVAAAEKLGRRVYSATADVLNPKDVEAFYAGLEQSFDHLDILVNLAGGVIRRPFMETKPEHWDHDIQRNYRYVLQSIQRAVPLIRKSGRGGSIINFTTIEAHRGAATFAAYAGAKAGLENFTRAVAVELGPERIRVNTIAPDQTPSHGNWNAMSEMGLTEIQALPPGYFEAAWKMYIPMEVPPPAQELGNAVVFLASDLAAYITGITLHVDGGCHASMGFNNWPYGDSWAPVPIGNILPRMFKEEFATKNQVTKP
jgi:NAD(P)-dependent dehydrogenase (short-subunit alcohol dehydrogenase family)